ncbi:hypothetical protein M0R04_16175 [Candidatus Dojkabacteria bacterium]|nr:hypothetical protein [Candidatus Dojkabacteria bacterium]
MKIFLLFLLVAFVLGSQDLFGQEKEIVYGSVRTDGYQKITKGAFWETRKEAKMICEGSIPPGCKVYTLSEEYFVRFIDNEHNKNDGNYIVFPEGAKVYTKDGFWYSAICGNRIEYLKPVTQVKIIEREKIVEVEKPVPESKVDNKLPVDFGATTSKAVIETQKAWTYERTESSPKKKKEIKILWFVIPVTAILAGVVGYLLLKKDKDQPSPQVIEPRTMPPGLPVLEPAQQPGLDADPRGMPSGLGS